MKTRQDFFFFVSAIVLLSGCSNGANQTKKAMEETTVETEKYRPRFHFTPEKNWMNDPNGMFYLNGKFHLYFQHHPESNVWGPMHWGHATSEDLIHWEHHPIALYPDELGTIFSGSAVVDLQNTSGFGTAENPPIVAIYTNHDAQAEQKGSIQFQNQSIAYSLDEGYTWTKFESNPVIQNPGIRDFRDPKVFWMESEKKWILTLAAGQETHFYGSPNLKEWTFLSSFGTGIGNHDGVWECPDLFPLKVNDSDETRWVHLVSINPGGPNGGSATQYFIGDFDGTQFTLDPDFNTDLEKNHHFWTDFGKDNYAGVTFSNWSDSKGNPLYLGWMSNWQYATSVPTYQWRSAMTLPRTLELIKTETSFRLKSRLPVNWETFVSKRELLKETKVNESNTIVAAQSIDLSSAKLNMKLKNLEKSTYTFVLSNQSGDSLTFGYAHEERQFFIDRSKLKHAEFSKDFSNKKSVAPRFQLQDELPVELVLDKASMELFYDRGETVMTEIFFPENPFESLTLITEKPGKTRIEVEVLELNIEK